MKSVLITGGSGLIGRALIKKLLERNYRVSVLSRNPALQMHGVRVFHWDVPACKMDSEALEQAQTLVHLAGAGIAEKRWTKKRKQEILSSRVSSAALLFDAVRQSAVKPKAYISSSAIGWYGGVSSERLMTEEREAAGDFMGRTCLLWELSADTFQSEGLRTVKIRSGVVLSRESGALPKMALPVKWGLGSALGSGKQCIPWIHIDDIAGIYLKAIEDEKMQGVFNAVAPAADSVDVFMHTLAVTLGKPYFMPPVPAFLLKAALGERAVLLTEGSRISAQKILNAGYDFRFPELSKALAQLYPRHCD